MTTKKKTTTTKKVVTVRMLDSESHRFDGPGTNAVHLRKGQVLDVAPELAERWVRIGLAKRVPKPKTQSKQQPQSDQGGGEG